MGVYSSDGMGHHSAGRAKMHEDKMAASKPKAAAPLSKPPATKMEAVSPHSIEDHVAQHGPAVEMHHKHDKASGKHHVTTHHGEGGKEKHVSEHETPEDAHEHMRTAMGLTTPDSEDQKEMDITPEQEAAEGTTGGGIPGMA